MARRRSGPLRVAAAALALLGAGCTTLREIPRTAYTTTTEREHVRLTTWDGRAYELDYVRIFGDSLSGYRRRDVPGRIEQYDSLGLALADVSGMSAHTIDWNRTLLIGGGVVLIAAIAGLAGTNEPSGSTSSGGGTIRPPE